MTVNTVIAWMLGIFAAFFLFLAVTDARAENVDAAIVMLVDVSGSMLDNERETARQAHITAIQSAEFITAIQGGELQKIAVAYVEFADRPATIVDWTIISDEQSAAAFANQIDTVEREPVGSQTGIGYALAHAHQMLTSLDHVAHRLVVDVVGDGRSSYGPPPSVARELIIQMDARINGLALMVAPDSRDLQEYYASQIAGGFGHFSIGITDISEMPMALRRKLLLELF